MNQLECRSKPRVSVVIADEIPARVVEIALEGAKDEYTNTALYSIDVNYSKKVILKAIDGKARRAKAEMIIFARCIMDEIRMIV